MTFRQTIYLLLMSAGVIAASYLVFCEFQFLAELFRLEY